MTYPTYLIHYNKNHSAKNGQFVSGDGDGDGKADERGRYTDKDAIRRANTPTSTTATTEYVTSSQLKTFGKAAKPLVKFVAGKAFSATKLGKSIKSLSRDTQITGRYFVKTTGFNKMMKQTNWSNYKQSVTSKVKKKIGVDSFKDRLYEEAANKINKGIEKYGGY